VRVHRRTDRQTDRQTDEQSRNARRKDADVKQHTGLAFVTFNKVVKFSKLTPNFEI